MSVPPLSDEDIRLLEEAWNDPAFYELSKDEGFVGAGGLPKPTTELSETEKQPGAPDESISTPH